jgi:hypothetical protein
VSCARAAAGGGGGGGDAVAVCSGDCAMNRDRTAATMLATR